MPCKDYRKRDGSPMGWDMNGDVQVRDIPRGRNDLPGDVRGIRHPASFDA
ncbi:MAG: hypothetical protein ACW97O_12040 [Candidatus Thorarchaeota archaeon]